MPISRSRTPRRTPADPPPVSSSRTGGAKSGRPQRSQKHRLITRVLVALAAGLCLVGLERLGMLNKLTGTSAMPGQLDWNNDYPLIQHLRDVAVDRGLTKDKKECLLFIVNGNDPPDAVRMAVREKHGGPCPGETGTLPLLFTFEVNRLAHTVRTDSGTPGQFHELP